MEKSPDISRELTPQCLRVSLGSGSLSLSSSSSQAIARIVATRALPGTVAILAVLTVPELSVGAGHLSGGQPISPPVPATLDLATHRDFSSNRAASFAEVGVAAPAIDRPEPTSLVAQPAMRPLLSALSGRGDENLLIVSPPLDASPATQGRAQLASFSSAQDASDPGLHDPAQLSSFSSEHDTANLAAPMLPLATPFEHGQAAFTNIVSNAGTHVPLESISNADPISSEPATEGDSPSLIVPVTPIPVVDLPEGSISVPSMQKSEFSAKQVWALVAPVPPELPALASRPGLKPGMAFSPMPSQPPRPANTRVAAAPLATAVPRRAPVHAKEPRAQFQVQSTQVEVWPQIQSQLLTRIGNKALGKIDFQQSSTGLEVRLGSLVELLGDRYEPQQVERIMASSAKDLYIPLAQLQAEGIPLSYDPVNDEFNLGLVDTRPKAARKVHIDQRGTFTGYDAPALGQVVEPAAPSTAMSLPQGLVGPSDGEQEPAFEAPPQTALAPPNPPVTNLADALTQTYRTNPLLMARRAELRRLDSAVGVERSAGKPQIVVGATVDQELYVTRPIGRRGRSLSAGADVSQLLYAGGRVRNSVRAAQGRVLAGRADLSALEGDLMTEAVAAYSDVLRDRAIRDLNFALVNSLQENLKSTQARYRVRDLTLTDVAQSEARLVVVQANLASAEGRLQASEENFERIVGARAGDLQPLPALPPMPLSADQAVSITLANNADIAALAPRARAADFDVAVARSARLPTLSVVVRTDYDNALGTANSSLGVPVGTLPNSATNITGGVALRFPLYQGGAVNARVSQAESSRAQLVEEAIAVERQVIADARSAYSIWRSALEAISFNELAVNANERALESVKVEQTIGARDVIDVLNAEQELLNGKIALVSAQRDAYVSAFELINTMGAAEAVDLNLEAGAYYEPAEKYRERANVWNDWGGGARTPPSGTRNVPSDAISPVTALQAPGRDDEDLIDLDE